MGGKLSERIHLNQLNWVNDDIMQKFQSNAWRFNKLLKSSQLNCNQGLTERIISWPGLQMKELPIALSGQCCDVTEFHTFLRLKT